MSPSACDVSVITVNWNGKDHLETLLPSLTVLQPREIILVDNGSSDGSQEFVRTRYPQVKILQNSVNQGFAQPNNLAAETAAGQYLAFINNDMRVDGKWLTAALARLSGRVVCVGSRILDWQGEKIDFNGSSLQYLGYAVQRDVGLPAETASNPDRILFACGGAMVVDREVFRRTGGFDEDYFAIFEDVDLGWRLWLAGHEIAFAPESLAFHKGHSTFKTQANEKMRYLMHRNALLTVLKNYEDEAFRKIFPLAVVMAIKRAVLFSGVEKERFYLWAPARQRLDHGDRSAHFQILDALNHLVALDDVLENLPSLLRKRATVQAMRQRPDTEIFNLFVDPFRTIVEQAEYLNVEKTNLDMFEISKLFEPFGCPPAVQDGKDQLEEKVALLRRELKTLQWQESQVSAHPVSLASSGLRRFIRTCRTEGFAAAWRRFLERVNRGL
ncbi:MAG: glycosyltransferase family 2 protein [Acidobacteria bacterium]|nr:MAG: glycosyltransferase family 2 protein [Acidobacteriota bacterium]